jgi:membrane-bound lytic murein transglycosylase D
MMLSNKRYRGRIGTATALLFLTACSTPPHRPEHEPKAETRIVQPASPEPGVAEKVESSAQSLDTPWQRLRNRFAFPGCIDHKAVVDEARRYTSNPTRFVENWRKAMPLLLLVLEEIERREMPGEFALLPYVESQYRLLPARHHGAAGMWQLMVRTAADRGLKINPAQDQRLDPQASTVVALDLLEHLDREFADWRLADMAFNAGEFRIKRALGRRPASNLDIVELAKLEVSATTHQHLVRLLALSCIVEDPDRFNVTLPLADAEDVLREVSLPTPIDVRLAASLAGISLQDLLSINAGWTSENNQAGPAARLLLPQRDVERFNTSVVNFPAKLLSEWHVHRIDLPIGLSSLASNLGLSPIQLALANQLEENSQLLPGQSLLLPGSETLLPKRDAAGGHRIVRGDTLSAIAMRYRTTVADLLRWNALTSKSLLRPGQTLLIRGPAR